MTKDAVRWDDVVPEPWEGNGPCMDCGGRSPHWHAPNDVWMQVMARDGFDAFDPSGLICPVCFIIRAWKKDPDGSKTWWTLQAIPDGFLPRGDFDWAIDRRNEAHVEIAKLRAALEAGWGAGQYDYAIKYEMDIPGLPDWAKR